MTSGNTAVPARALRVCRSWLLMILAVCLAGPAHPQVDAKAPRNDQAILASIRSKLPPAPENFDWALFKNAVFVKPKGWIEKRVNVTGSDTPMFVYAMSGEAFSETKQFETGFTINVFSGSQRLRGIPAKKLVALYLQPFIETHQRADVLLFDQKDHGDFLEVVFRYRDTAPGQRPVIVHKLMLANDKSDALDVFTFQSPEATFTTTWDQVGTPILNTVSVVPNVPIQ